MESAQDLIDNVKEKQKKLRKRSVLERGVPLVTLKSMTVGQAKRLEKSMKGGKI